MADPLASPLFDERESSMTQHNTHAISPVRMGAFDSPGGVVDAEQRDGADDANASMLDHFGDDAAASAHASSPQPQPWSLQAHLQLHSPPQSNTPVPEDEHDGDVAAIQPEEHDSMLMLQKESEGDSSNITHDHSALDAPSPAPAPASASGASQFHSPSEFGSSTGGEKGLLDESVHIPGDPLLRVARDPSASPVGATEGTSGDDAGQDEGADDVTLAAQPLSPSPTPAASAEAHSILADTDSILASAGLSPLAGSPSAGAGGLSPLAEVAEDALSPVVIKRRTMPQQQQQQQSTLDHASSSPLSPSLPQHPDFSAAATTSPAATAGSQEEDDLDSNIAASYRTVQFTIPKHAGSGGPSSSSSRRTASSGSSSATAGAAPSNATPKHRHTMSASVAGSHRPTTSALSSSTARAGGSSSAGGGRPPLGSPATGSVGSAAGTPSRGGARNSRRSTAPKDLVWPSPSPSGAAAATLGFSSTNATGSPSAPSSPSPAERLARLEERNATLARELARTSERLEATIQEKEGLSSKLSMLELAREMERLDGGSGGGGGGMDGSGSGSGIGALSALSSSPASSPLSPPVASPSPISGSGSGSGSSSIVPPLQFSALSPQGGGHTPAHRTGFSWSASAAAAAATAAGLNSSFGTPRGGASGGGSSISTPRGQTPQELEIMQGFVKAHSALTAISFRLHENRVAQHRARKELLAASSVPLTPASAAAIEAAQNNLSALLKARTALCAELHAAERTRRRVAQRWFDFDLEHAHAIADAGGRSADGADDDDDEGAEEDEPLDETGERRPSRRLNIGQALAFSPSSRKKLAGSPAGGVGVEELQASIAALRAQNQRLELQHAEALRAAEKARADALAAQAFRDAEVARQAEVARFAAESKALAEKKAAEAKAQAEKESAARVAEAALAARVAAEVAKALADRELQRKQEEDAVRAAEQARAKQEADDLRAQLRAALALQQQQQHPEPINTTELGIQSNLHQAVLGLNGSGAPGSAERAARRSRGSQDLLADPAMQEQMADAAQIEAIQRRMAARTSQQQPQQPQPQQGQGQGQGSKRNSPRSTPALTSPDGGRVFSLREFQALQAAQASQQQSDSLQTTQQSQSPALDSLSPDDERRLLAEAHHRAAQLSAVLAAQDAYLASQSGQLRNQDALIAQQFTPMPDPLLMATASMQANANHSHHQQQQQQHHQQPQQRPQNHRQESLELTESLRLMAENQSQIDEVDSAIRDITNTARSRRAQQQQQGGGSNQLSQQMQPSSANPQHNPSLDIASADQRVAEQRRRDEELHRQFLATQPSLYEQMLVRPRPSPQHQQAFAATQSAPLHLSSQFQPLPQQTPQPNPQQRQQQQFASATAMTPSTPDASFLRSVQFTPSASPRPSQQQHIQMQPYNPSQQQPHQQMAQSLAKQQQRSTTGGGPVAVRAVPSASKPRSGLSATEPTRSLALAAASSAHPPHLYTSRNGSGTRALNPAQSHVVQRMVEVATLSDPAAAAKVARVEKAHAAAVEKHAAQIRAQADQRAAQQQEKLAKLLALNARDENAVVPLSASSAHHTGSAKKKRASSGGVAMRPAPSPTPLQHAPPPSAYLPDGTLMLRTAANERRMSSSNLPSSHELQMQQLQPGGYSSAGNSARSSRAGSPIRRQGHSDADSSVLQQQQHVAPSDLHLQLQAASARAPPPSASPLSFAATSTSYLPSGAATNPGVSGASTAFSATAPASAFTPAATSSFPSSSSSHYAHLNGAAHAQQSPVVPHTMNGSSAHDPAASYLFGSGSGPGSSGTASVAPGSRYTPAPSSLPVTGAAPSSAASSAAAPVTEYVSGGEALAVLENARARYRAQLLQEQADKLAMQQHLQQQQREEPHRMQQQQQQTQRQEKQPERSEY